MSLTRDYEISSFTPNFESYPLRWASESKAFREALLPEGRAELDIAYGPAVRNMLDVFLPVGRPRGAVVFIHGGYWQAFDKSSWSYLAAGPAARGWAVALPSYTLAPEASLSEITGEIALAVTKAASLVEGPLIVTGHSAGGHLSARMRCRDVWHDDTVAGRIANIVPISPISDLRPLMQTDMNAALKIDDDIARTESPLLHTDLLNVPTTVWLGAEERPSFLDQARWLAETWPTCTQRIVPGRHHFDVIEDLTDPYSPLTRTLLDEVENRA